MPLHQRDLVICEAALPADHPDIAVALENYSDTLRKLDRDDEAYELAARAHAIRVKRAENRR